MSRDGYSQWFRPSTGGSATSMGRIYLSTSQTTTALETLDPIPFDASDLDTDGYADVAHNRIVIPTGFGGWFDVSMRVGARPVSAITGGTASIFLLTVADGIRDYSKQPWRYIEDLDTDGRQTQWRTYSTLNLADGDLLYATWQDQTSGGSGFFVIGGNGGGLAAPESYLQVERRS